MQEKIRLGNKGQITLFIIIGIVMLAIVAVVVVMRFTGPEQGVNVNVASVESYVDNCLEKVAIDGLWLMGTQAGYIELPEDFVSTNYSDIPVLYDKGVLNSLSRHELENELNIYINEFLPFCTNNLEPFRDQFNIIAGEPVANSTINKDNVIINLNYPITLKVNEVTREIKEFSTRFEFRAGNDFDIVEAILISIGDNPDYIDFTLLQSFDVNVTLIPYDGTMFVYGIEDPFIERGNDRFKILFAARYR